MINEYEIEELPNNKYRYEDIEIYAPNIEVAIKRLTRMFKETK